MFPEHISYSALKTWRECQWKWKLQYVDKIYDVDDFGVYRDFGKAIHRTIELARPNKNKKAITYPLKHFKRVFALLYKKHKDKYPDKDKTLEYDDFIVAGQKIIEDFLSHDYLSESTVINNELKFYEVIGRTDDVEIKFKGVVDLIILGKDGRGKDVIYICDFKTTKWGWRAEDKQDPDNLAQLFLYKHFICKKFNIDPKGVRCAFVLLKRNPPKKNPVAVEFIPVSAGPVSVQRAVDEFNRDISEMVNRFKSGKIQKNRSMCIHPRFKSVCKFYNTPHCPNNDIGLKTIIAGSRDINSYEEVCKAIQDSGFVIREVVSGKARGVDTLGERWAKENDVPIKDCYADWDKLGKKAGPIRNQEMAEYAEALILIYDGVSRGSSDMLERAKKKGLQIHVHIVEKNEKT